MKAKMTFPVLTAREQEILRLVVAENSNLEISELLQISIRTVETHRKNINRKTKVRSLAGLTQFAIKTGLLEHFSYQAGRSVRQAGSERCHKCGLP
ncbi:MAG: LuxR C-terminal-related transcriptional regulator [Lentimicrobiaceae bacterium]|nr:LuxR C-terminal-related transcriptional regulator [Lentimicrobiaceae bacterium]